ncbi:Protein of unknown function [Micromonospora lupini str. Lupac 08]|uniref:Uncharacterized protein n=1 Tax=Micromonospora lupini str. Lupac 08 TaxID=1150864 RepID=I0L7M7_9ACTN|nr:Protein of unknown function [Micromonospora lupini str. Lupac 08]
MVDLAGGANVYPFTAVAARRVAEPCQPI